MKITFQNNPLAELQTNAADQTTKNTKTSKRESISAAAFGAVLESGQTVGLPGTETEKTGSLIELQQQAGGMDVGLSQDYMTVMSNTMSDADYAKACEDGFTPETMSEGEAVTILDRIKIELARSGQVIEGYTDDIDVATLTEVLGSAALAQSVQTQFAGANLPLTQENINDIKTAWELASSLTRPSEGAVSYLVDNALSPEIWNLYVAENSGAGRAAVSGDLADTQAQMLLEGLDDEIRRVIEEAGLSSEENSQMQAEWLVTRGLPLTRESLHQLVSLEEIPFPVTEETFSMAAAEAIAEGESTVHASLAVHPAQEKGETLYQKAIRIDEEWHSEEKWQQVSGNLTARKQLEEIRLRMTAEVNVKLLRSDFSIDTAPMEELIEALRTAEEEVAGKYFPADDQAVSKYELLQETVTTLKELPGLPAAVLGPYSLKSAEESLSSFHTAGRQLQQAYEQAGERYEALMTAPRSDLGDSITKAFSNIDELLSEAGVEQTAENERAARILGYNRMALTAENIDLVRTADTQVRHVIERLTPASVLKMIRDQVNPLEQSFEQLTEYFDSLPVDYAESSESYSRFLYRLEQNHEITDTEREAYIGIYRMVHQVEKADSAAIGTVLSENAELNFATLLTAARSRRVGHVDVMATTDMGLIQELVRSDKSISEQIARAMQTSAEADLEAVDRAYDREAAAALREVTKVQPQAVELVGRGEVTMSAANLLASQALLTEPEELFEQLENRTKRRGEKAQSEESAKWESLVNTLDDDAFSEEYVQSIKESIAGIEERTIVEAVSSLDVKALQLAHKQLSLMNALSEAQERSNRGEYFLPLTVGDRIAGVHLTMSSDGEAKGLVDITLSQKEIILEAHLQLTNGAVSGFLVGNTEEEVTKLAQAADIFRERIQTDASADLTVRELTVVGSLGGTRMAARESENADQIEHPTDNATLYRLAKTFLQAVGEV